MIMPKSTNIKAAERLYRKYMMMAAFSLDCHGDTHD